MKKIKVKYCKYNNTDEKTPQTYSYFIHNILTKYYDVEVSDDPDYIFFHETSGEYLNYDCIRINYTGENVSANFNLTDYAIGFDYLSFGDRYYRLPIYLINNFYRPKEVEQSKDIDLLSLAPLTTEEFEKKTEFCSFVYSNYLAGDSRKDLFNKLSEYKKVNSGGKYLNNVGGPVDNKLEFESRHKFSIACENSSRSGYTTEKIVCSLLAKTIPIYWGSPDVAKEFNSKRFINCHDYQNLDEVLFKVKELDNNQELFLEMVRQPIFADNFSPRLVLHGFEKFLCNIIDQPLEKAKRRTINPARAKDLEDNERLINKYNQIRNIIIKILASLYKPLKNIKAVDDFKKSILYRK